MAPGEPTSPRYLRFFWWNAQDFAHYEYSRRRTLRWPPTRAAFEEKTRRVAAVVKATCDRFGAPHLIGLAEVTRRAAEALRDALRPRHYAVHSLDVDDQ